MVLDPIKNLGKALIRRALPESLQKKILLSRIRNDLRSYPARTVKHVYGGIPLQVRIEDRVAQDWYDHDWPKLSEIQLLALHQLKSGARVFDVGAHQGVVAMMIGHQVGPQGHVLAIEANPHNARVATESCRLNGLTQVEVLQQAVSDRACQITMNEDPNGQIDDSGKLGTIQVQASSLDDLSRKYGMPQVVFLDVEGFELHCLKGGKATLDAQPDCFIEVHVGTGLEKFGGSVAEVLAYFPTDRYDLRVGTPQDEKDFVTLDPSQPSPGAFEIMKKRFHLLALSRKTAS